MADSDQALCMLAFWANSFDYDVMISSTNLARKVASPAESDMT